MTNTNIAPKGFRILIVEDDEVMRTFYADVLRMFGFNSVIIARSGEEALEKIQVSVFPYDLIIIDWGMPTMTGMELLQKIRQSPDSPNFFTPILFATGMGQGRHVQEARDAGVNEFLVKPFTIEDLKRKLHAIYHHPRDFIVCEQFNGPCRRRKKSPIPMNGPERRKAA